MSLARTTAVGLAGAIAGFAIGYFAILQSIQPASTDKIIFPTPIPIDGGVDTAQQWVNNDRDTTKFIYIDNNTLYAISQLSLSGSDGTFIYNGMSNNQVKRLVLVKTRGGRAVSEYYYIDASRVSKDIETCPTHCDIVAPLTLQNCPTDCSTCPN